MLKRKINQYNDGMLKFGKYKEKYNENNDLLNEKEKATLLSNKIFKTKRNERIKRNERRRKERYH